MDSVIKYTKLPVLLLVVVVVINYCAKSRQEEYFRLTLLKNMRNRVQSVQQKLVRNAKILRPKIMAPRGVKLKNCVSIKETNE